MPNFLIRKQLIALGDDFWVEDEDGNRVFHIDGKVLRPRDTYVLETADGESPAPPEAVRRLRRDGDDVPLGHRQLLLADVKVAVPAWTTKTSGYGWRCNAGPCPRS